MINRTWIHRKSLSAMIWDFLRFDLHNGKHLNNLQNTPPFSARIRRKHEIYDVPTFTQTTPIRIVLPLSSRIMFHVSPYIHTIPSCVTYHFMKRHNSTQRTRNLVHAKNDKTSSTIKFKFWFGFFASFKWPISPLKNKKNKDSPMIAAITHTTIFSFIFNSVVVTGFWLLA